MQSIQTCLFTRTFVFLFCDTRDQIELRAATAKANAMQQDAAVTYFSVLSRNEDRLTAAKEEVARVREEMALAQEENAVLKAELRRLRLGVGSRNTSHTVDVSVAAVRAISLLRTFFQRDPISLCSP